MMHSQYIYNFAEVEQFNIAAYVCRHITSKDFSCKDQATELIISEFHILMMIISSSQH